MDFSFLCRIWNYALQGIHNSIHISIERERSSVGSYDMNGELPKSQNINIASLIINNVFKYMIFSGEIFFYMFNVMCNSQIYLK